MRVGLQVLSFTWQGGAARLGETFALIARNAERAGFSSLWVDDHFFQIPTVGPVEHEMLEGYTALAFAAGHTNRIKLGTLVTGVTYRPPGILVKTVTTLDVLSHGRAYLGIGAAWDEQEHRGLGVPFPPVAERFERLEETLRIALQMWSGSQEPIEGKHYHLERPLNSPQSIRRPHPPILIGGTGERKTLRLVAHYADACNLFAFLGDDELKRKLDVLREHCQRIGRPFEAIQKTTLDTLFLTADGRNGSITPAQAVEHFVGLAALGFDEVIVNLPNVSELEVFDLLAEQVVPEVSKLPVAGR
jgi:F420-dependent oxidoreductase-like protein